MLGGMFVATRRRPSRALVLIRASRYQDILCCPPKVLSGCPDEGRGVRSWTT